LVSIAESFGLSHRQALETVSSMLIGAARVMIESGLGSDEVMDLIPARPMAEEEDKIKKIYNQKIKEIYNRLKS